MGQLLEVVSQQWAGVALGALLTALLARLNRLWDARRERSTSAAAVLTESLGHVERVVRGWRFRELAPDEVRTAMEHWDVRWKDNSGLLPDGWCHLNRDVRFAVGNSLGGAAALAADTGLDDTWGADTFEYHWWDVSLSYLEHVRSRLHNLQLAGRARRRRGAPGDYHLWRAEEDRERTLSPEMPHGNPPHLLEASIW